MPAAAQPQPQAQPLLAALTLSLAHLPYAHAHCCKIESHCPLLPPLPQVSHDKESTTVSYLEYFDVSQPERVAALLERAMKARRWAGWAQNTCAMETERGVRVVRGP